MGKRKGSSKSGGAAQSENDDGDDDDDDDEDQSGSDDSEDDSEHSDNDLKNLVNSLPQAMRQKVLMKNSAEDDESDSEGEESVQEESWGKKGQYWGNEVHDLEIGQSMDDAVDEAEAAQELQKEKVSRMQEEDFMDDYNQNSSDEEEEVATMGSLLKGKKNATVSKSAAKRNTKLLLASANGDDERSQGLVLGSLGQHSDVNVQVEHITRDLSKLTKGQRLDLIAAQSPEFPGIVAELTERIAELKSTVIPVKSFLTEVAKTQRVDDDIVEYLEVKQQLLLSYCVNVVFYLYMKAEGKSVRSHPVMKQLLKLRYVMEKMRSLDSKLKYQIDRLVKLADMSPSEASQAAGGLLRPNPAALLARDNGDASEEESEEEEVEAAPRGKKSSNAADGLYKPPRLTAMPYKENESAAAKKESRLDSKKKKLRDSELMDALRDEFGTAPETSASGGISTQAGDLKRLAAEQDERDRFEEDRFVRMTMSRKDKKDIKRRTADASRLDNFDDIGDVGDFEEIAKLVGRSSSAAGGARGGNAAAMEDSDDDADYGRKGSSKAGANALQRAVEALGGGKKGARGGDVYSDDDEEGDELEQVIAHKRRRAPDSRMDEEDDTLLEDFGSKKKAYLAKKSEHYTAEPRYGGQVDMVEDGKKRAATYEIMKNKGLTPHRKKENRNPRVKKRAAYAKAVVNRKGQVRDVITGNAGGYSGEMTGVKANVSRSRKIA
eukprot:gene22961-29146_t